MLGVCEWFTEGLAEETSERRVAVKGVSGLSEFNAVEQALDVTRDRVRCDDQRGIKRMNVLARNRSLCVSNKGAIVTSINPRSFAILAKLCLNTCGMNLPVSYRGRSFPND